MASPSKKILLFGATGVIGKVLLDTILSSKDKFDRIGIFTSAETCDRKPELIQSIKSRGAEVLTGDLYNDADVLKAYQEFDTVVSALGRSTIDKQVDLIRLAEQSSSIIRFIPSEFGTDVAFNATSAKEKPHQKKLKVRAFIESEAIRRLKYTYIVTGPFADLYIGALHNEPQIGSFEAQTKQATLLGDGQGQIALMTMADVGRALVAVLEHPEICDGKAIKVNSFVTTPDAILREFERQSNAKWSVQYTSLEELRGIEEKAWDEGHPLAAVFTLRRIWTEGATLYEEVDNERIGMVKMDTLEMVVQEAIAKPMDGFRSGKL